MNDIYNFFEGNPWLNILFLILAITGIIISFILYKKSLKIKIPVYNIKTITLVDQNISTIRNIEIKYKGSILHNLSLSKLSFWNAGKEPIRREDIAPSNLLTISTKEKDIIIYDFEIIHQNSVNNIVLERSSQGDIKISFDFLDYNDGMVVNIYHSGNSNNDLQIHGTLIGAKKIAYGIKEQVFTNEINRLYKPINYLANHKFAVVRILGFFVATPLLFLILPFGIVSAVLDYILDKLSRKKIPTEYYLE